MGAIGDEKPSQMWIVDTLGAFMTDEACVTKARESIQMQFKTLQADQDTKGKLIQEKLDPYNSYVKELFRDWKAIEEKKTKIVNDNLENILNCSGLVRAGRRIAAVPGQVVASAKNAATTTRNAAINTANITKRVATEAANTTRDVVKTGATIAVGVPIIAGQKAYSAGKDAVKATVNAAEQAKLAAQNKINQTKEAVEAKKESLIARLGAWVLSFSKNAQAQNPQQ